VAGQNILNATKVPALPFAPDQYERSYPDTVHNILRQYFNTLDNVTGQLLAPAGGRFLSNPHIAAQDSTDQYATGTNVATRVRWNTLDSGEGFTLNPTGTATATYTGVYKIDYSLQLFNTSSQIHEVFVWLQVNGANVAGSTSVFSVAERHGGVNGAMVAYSSITFTVTGGDEIGLFWATNAAASAGGATGVYLHAEPAQTTPFLMPSIPSAIGSIVFVSGVSP
jgi:hypothetical protein